MNTKHLKIIVFVFALALSTIACGLIDQAIGGNTQLTTVSQLWSDVPRMDGLEPSQMEMPFYGKVLMRTFMNQVLGEGKDTGDWIVFSTSKTPADIKNFYTPQLMTANGWDPSDNSTCLSGKDQGVDQVGIFCVFQKTESDKTTGLMIIAGQNSEDNSKLDVLFVRVQNLGTPSP